MMFNAKHIHKIATALALVALFFLVTLLSKGLRLDSTKTQSPLVGKSAKEFHVRMIQGANALLGHRSDFLDLGQLKGSPFIINFWASWCSTCAEEAKTLETFWKEHGSEGVKVLGIAVHDRWEDVVNVTKSLGKTYPIALDEEGHASLNYGVTGVPETVFINAQGVVIHKEVGPLSRSLLNRFLKQLKASST
jgi:cytochrome c biogenesis protein CcmG/thiol:disulfide interchange protein DsbE